MTILEEMTTLMALCMKLNHEALYAYVTAGNCICNVWVVRKNPDGGQETIYYWTHHKNLNGDKWVDEMKSERTSFDAIVRELEEMNA